jgi:hypothetical protein
MSVEYKLTCIKGLGSVLSSVLGETSAALTFTAGFQRLPPAHGCNSGGFSRGVPYFSGEASISVGGSLLYFRGSLRGKVLLGLMCTDRQSRGSPIQVGVSVVASGTLKIPGYASAFCILGYVSCQVSRFSAEPFYSSPRRRIVSNRFAPSRRVQAAGPSPRLTSMASFPQLRRRDQSLLPRAVVDGRVRQEPVGPPAALRHGLRRPRRRVVQPHR